MNDFMRSGTARLGLAMALACSFIVRAEATSLRLLDLPTMVQSAKRVVHARASATRVYWDEQRRGIFTDTDFEVLEEAKGKGPARLTVTMLGGRIDPIEMRTEGTPEFEIGEEVLLMTTPRPDGRQNIVGFSQGVFRVHRNPLSGERFVTVAGSVEDPGTGQPAAQAGRSPRPLATFLEQIRILASGAGAPPESPRMRLVPVPRGEVRR